MKSALSQGLSAQLPTVWETRLGAAMVRMFPSYASVRLFASPERAREAVSLFLGRPAGGISVHDPAMDPPPTAAPLAALWRPFLPLPTGARVLLPVLPLTVCGVPAPACFPSGLPRDFPASDALPGFLLSGALRALSSLASCTLGGSVVERAVDGNPAWGRIGPYVCARFPAAEYPSVHGRFLRAGVLLRPAYPGPSVLPGECSPGEIRLLAELFAGTPGG
jgi:hypothetical protein